jgi:predicted Holliday junction resolvase-like endonuclease
MTNALVRTVDGLQEILAICPCCGELFRLVDAKFIFPQRHPKNSEYLTLISIENEMAEIEESLSEAENSFALELELLREPLREQGRQQARQKIKNIDPIFSARDIDPQDAKALMHPVEYIIFHGLTAGECIDPVELVSRTPSNRAEEIIVQSIEKVISEGYVCFETLRMKDNGTFEIQEA